MHTIPYQTSQDFYKSNIDEESILKRGWTPDSIIKYLVPADVKLLMKAKNNPLKFLKIYDLEKIEKIETIFGIITDKEYIHLNSTKESVEKIKDKSIYSDNTKEELTELYKKYYPRSYIVNKLKVSYQTLITYFQPDKICINPYDPHKPFMKLYLKFKIDDYLKDRTKQKGSISGIKPNKYNPQKKKHKNKKKFNQFKHKNKY